ncbi:MAG: alginate export family protein [Candidatus Krumholzibacteriia bacterium]
MKRSVLASVLLCLSFGTGVFAQTEWTLSGQVRYRFESDMKDFNNDSAANNFNVLRSRLAASFKPSDDVTALIQLQDSRVLGEEKSTLGDGSADHLDFHQAYVKVDDLFEWPVSLKAGRMEVIYGSQRLVGPVGWDNIGRSFDGVMVNLHGEHFSVDLFEFNEVDSVQIGDRGDRNIYGAYADIKHSDNYKNQVFFIWQQTEPSDELSRYTVGFYSQGKAGRFFHETEFAYQGGNITPGAVELDVEAFMATLSAGFRFPALSAAPAVSAGVDYLSGDDNPADDKFKVFDTLYATNHKFYGFMDYFLNIPVHTFGLGLIDAHGEVAVTPAERTKAKIAYHYFSAVEDYRLADGSTSTGFGQELDVTINHAYTESVAFTGGVSVFGPRDIFDEKKGTDTAAWLYAMVTVNL